VLVLATSSGLYYSRDLKTWSAAQVTGMPAGGFSFVGMTNTQQGVAVPDDRMAHEIFTTSDGGVTWLASPIR